jgi:type I restriction enzyme S subunit
MHRIKWLLSERIEKSKDGLGEPLSMSQKLGIVPTKEMDIIPNMASSYIGAKKVQQGDLVFNKLKAHLGVFAVSNYDGLVSPDYAVYIPTERIHLPYLELLLRTQYYITEFRKKTTGVAIGLTRLYTDGLFGISAIYPPIAEQEKIVSYLESKTSKIDAYVADKEKEIQLLQELKQKTIAEAVTKGLNPYAKMKDSGISWIGEIPEHWETRRAKFMFKKNKRERRPEDEVITCFRDGQVTLRKNRRLTGFTESEKFDGYQGIRKGDLVIHQMDAFAGSIGVSDSDGMGTSVYHCCTPTGDYNVYYYANLIRQMALSGFIQSLYKGIRERSSDFSFPVFGNQYLTIPPLDEQQAIVAYIEEKCKKIDKLASELQSEIDYLKEYKQRLIADCVTGQVKV